MADFRVGLGYWKHGTPRVIFRIRIEAETPDAVESAARRFADALFPSEHMEPYWEIEGTVAGPVT